MKFKLNPAFEQASGALGDLVFRKVKGKTIVSRKPSTNGELTAAQAEHRQRFKQAAAYGKFAMAAPATRAIYDAASAEKDVPAFALCVADFLNLPKVESLNVAAYTGQAGEWIQVTTSDDFGVVNVHVRLTDGEGTLLESGNAIENPVGTGHWTYTTTVEVPAGTTVNIQVIATDRPGGTAIQNTSKTL